MLVSGTQGGVGAGAHCGVGGGVKEGEREDLEPSS